MCYRYTMGYPQTLVGVRAGESIGLTRNNATKFQSKKCAERSAGKRSISHTAEQSFLAIGPVANQDEAFDLHGMNNMASCVVWHCWIALTSELRTLPQLNSRFAL